MQYLAQKLKKQKLNTKDFIPYRQFKADMFRERPGAKKAYDALEFEYKIINALISARIKNKLTQRGLADKIGVAQSALARFESGRVDPRISFVKKVTEGLGLKITVK